MVPTALAVNEGSEFRAPMAVAVIFGLALATGVSLLLVPASYVIWDNIAEGFTRLGRRLFGGKREEMHACNPLDPEGTPEDSDVPPPA
jgi:hypothetical protein